MAEGDAPAPRGRPRKYTRELAAKVLQALEDEGSLRKACKLPGMPPHATVRGWVIDDVDGFAALYTRARDVVLDDMADECIEIADRIDNDTVMTDEGERPNTEWLARSRLKFDARRWYLSKLAPKRYGDQLNVQLNGSIAIDDDGMAERMAQIMSAVTERIALARREIDITPTREALEHDPSSDADPDYSLV